MTTHVCNNLEHPAVSRFCSNCLGSDYEDNRMDEALYVAAAQEAPRLRYEGAIDDAVEVLSALYAIRIVNFVRPKFRSCSCGAQFDE